MYKDIYPRHYWELYLQYLTILEEKSYVMAKLDYTFDVLGHISLNSLYHWDYCRVLSVLALGLLQSLVCTSLLERMKKRLNKQQAAHCNFPITLQSRLSFSAIFGSKMISSEPDLIYLQAQMLVDLMMKTKESRKKVEDRLGPIFQWDDSDLIVEETQHLENTCEPRCDAFIPGLNQITGIVDEEVLIDVKPSHNFLSKVSCTQEQQQELAHFCQQMGSNILDVSDSRYPPANSCEDEWLSKGEPMISHRSIEPPLNIQDFISFQKELGPPLKRARHS